MVKNWKQNWHGLGLKLVFPTTLCWLRSHNGCKYNCPKMVRIFLDILKSSSKFLREDPLWSKLNQFWTDLVCCSGKLWKVKCTLAHWKCREKNMKTNMYLVNFHIFAKWFWNLPYLLRTMRTYDNLHGKNSYLLFFTFKR